MTTEPDQNAGGNAAATKARRLKPASVQIDMPTQDRDDKAQPRAMDTVEGMLARLLDRLDDNDKRYGAALSELNQRLNDLSQRTQNAGAAQNQTSGETLERLRTHASQLAAQVTEAGAAHHTQGRQGANAQRPRMDTYANDDRPAPDLGDSRLNTDFADVTQRLDRSLSSRAPAGEIDLITRRLDELGGRLDVALSRQNDAAALQAIEEQLRALSAGFGEARQNYARVEAIEQNLASLMNWAHSGGGQPNGTDAARLDAIEQALNALDRNARDMDARTVSTLEAMNDALHSIASSNGQSAGFMEAPAIGAPPERNAPQPQSQAPGVIDEPAASEPVSEVWIEQQLDASHEAGSDRAAELEAELGKSIPDYQPAPGRMSQSDGTPQRTEPTFDSSNDFIESARRAAAAAAQEPARKASANGLGKRLAASFAKSKPDEAGKPRRILYVLAAGLMLTSAGLMYARLNSQPPASAPSVEKPLATQPDAPAPEQSGNAPGKQGGSSQNKQPQPVKPPVNKTSERMSRTGPAENSVPVASSRSTSTAPAPKPSMLKSDGPVSTATVLASLTPSRAKDQMSGVSIDITEPERAPAPRAKTARAVAPLVPETAPTPARNPLALPKRIPAPASTPKQKTTAINRSNTDSARASETVRPAHGNIPAASMPPARIGPNSLRVAAARGNPAAQVEIASRYAKGTGVPKDMKKASEWYGRAAAQGFAPGQYRLAALFERGQGVKKDINIARTWYRRAAELGNVRAMHNLAVLYTRAEGKGPDYTSAKNWFYQAARYGLADSQFNLGILYDSGLGVRKNAAEAYKWFALAARQGDREAAKRREALRPRLPARSLSAVEQTIRKWRAVKPPEEANRSGAPRGGWRNAKGGNPQQGLTDKARILRAQVLLNKLGYDAGAPDGKLGPQTASAIRRFQSRAGLSRTPGLTAEMLQRLEALAG